MSAPESRGVDPATVDLGLVDRIECAGVECWPPTCVDALPSGWILRATPGLDGGRLGHALTPRTRRLEDGELAVALERVRAWSALHGIRGGLQVTPLELQGASVPGLVAAGWEPLWKCWVMAADRADALERAARRGSTDQRAAAAVGLRGRAEVWTSARQPDSRWLATWAACQPSLTRQVVESHAATTFAAMGERGVFGRLGDSATGVAVEDAGGEWAGLFSLVVRPDRRGCGLGRRLCQSLLADVSAPRIYLQVTMDNAVALALYTSLGFRPVHSYQHLQAPPGWAVRD